MVEKGLTSTPAQDAYFCAIFFFLNWISVALIMFLYIEIYFHLCVYSFVYMFDQKNGSSVGPSGKNFMCYTHRIYVILSGTELQSFIDTFSLSLSWSLFLKSLPQSYILTAINYYLGRGKKKKSVTTYFKLKCMELFLHFNDYIWHGRAIKPNPDNYQTVFSMFLLLEVHFTFIQW